LKFVQTILPQTEDGKVPLAVRHAQMSAHARLGDMDGLRYVHGKIEEDRVCFAGKTFMQIYADYHRHGNYSRCFVHGD
jgi:hypothetical protein